MNQNNASAVGGTGFEARETLAEDDVATGLLAAASTGCARSFEAFYRLTSHRT